MLIKQVIERREVKSNNLEIYDGVQDQVEPFHCHPLLYGATSLLSKALTSEK